MPIIIGFVVFFMVIGGIAKVQDMFFRDPEWTVEINDRDAFRLAATILGRGQVSGCGDFRVRSQYPGMQTIVVECGPDNDTKFLEYWPELAVDGRPVTRDPWEKAALGSVYCVKHPSGEWDKAYLSLSDAYRRAIRLSTEHDEAVRIYDSESLMYWTTQVGANGKWGRMNAAYDEVDSRSERRGCELETRRLSYMSK